MTAWALVSRPHHSHYNGHHLLAFSVSVTDLRKLRKLVMPRRGRRGLKPVECDIPRDLDIYGDISFQHIHPSLVPYTPDYI